MDAGNGLIIRVESLKSDAFVTRQTSPIALAGKKLMEISGNERASDDTPQINELKNIICEHLHDVIIDLQSNAKKTQFYPVRAESASEVLKVVNRRDSKKMLYGTYAERGFEIRALENDLFTPEMALHLEQSETKGVFELVKQQFDMLTVLLANRTNETNLPTTTIEQRQILRYRIEKLLHHIDANILDNVAGYDKVKEPVTQLINEILAKHKAETTRKENRKGSSDKDEE